ncbi:MAG: DoxX family protein [Gemmatimonadota bacterium]|nr:DoxX family protein [Gemmatimonadota bacterium]
MDLRVSEAGALTTPFSDRDWRSRLGLTWSRLLLAALFIFAGVMHFVVPASYAAIVPQWLPNAPLLVVISGVAEILGGLGVLLPQTRRLAGWGLIALLVAVFPANIHMLQLGQTNHAPAYWMAALWLRLPLQLLMLWWVWRVAARPAR